MIYHDRPASLPERPRSGAFGPLLLGCLALGLAVAWVIPARGLAWLTWPMLVVALAGMWRVRGLELLRNQRRSLSVGALVGLAAAAGWSPLPESLLGYGPNLIVLWAFGEAVALDAARLVWPVAFSGWRRSWPAMARGVTVAGTLLVVAAWLVGTAGTPGVLAGWLSVAGVGAVLGAASLTVALRVLAMTGGEDPGMRFDCPRCGWHERWQQGGSSDCGGCGLVVRADWGSELKGTSVPTRKPVEAVCPSCGRPGEFGRGVSSCASCGLSMRLEWAEHRGS